MTTLRKILMALLASALFIYSFSTVKTVENQKGTEPAVGSTPSSSYQYHLQIFHAF